MTGTHILTAIRALLPDVMLFKQFAGIPVKVSETRYPRSSNLIELFH